MHFSPRQAQVLAALCKLQEHNQREGIRQGITYAHLRKETGIEHVPRILAGIKERKKILIRTPHESKTTLALNPNTIVTTGLVARMLIELHWATRSDHIKIDDFKKRVFESPFFQKARHDKKGEETDEEYFEAVLTWGLGTDPPYIHVGHEAKDRIGTTDRVQEDRVQEEMDYLDLIAIPLEETSQ